MAGGCGGSSAVSSAVDPVARAAKVTELAPGFKMSVSAEISAPGPLGTINASGTGVFDQRNQRGALSIKTDVTGHATTVDTQYSRLAVYMRLPSSQRPSLAHGKPWVKLDVRRLGAAVGINVAALSGSGASSNPSQFLSYLKAAAGKVIRVGSEPVRDVSSTHYRATINYDRYASTVAPAERTAASNSVAVLERVTGSHSQVVDAWVDNQHRVRREELTYHMCVPELPYTLQIHTNLEFFDFGTQAIPEVPPSNEVADLTSQVAGKLKHIKLACH